MKIARVFPRRTSLTPGDSYAFTGPPGLFVPRDIEEVHVSVLFTYDIDHAKFLAEQWKRVAPVKMGGPAFGKPGGEFTPGKYLRPNAVVTSRGCPNKCWFCTVWRREGGIKELKTIHSGDHLCDDNILATSEGHIRRVFDMLSKRKKPIMFGGGLEAARFKDWHIELFYRLHKKPFLYFAYDEEADYEPLVEAAKKLWKTDFMDDGRTNCYVLIGYPKDTMEAAEERLKQVVRLGFFPIAMLYRNFKGETTSAWRYFQTKWCSRRIASYRVKKMENEIIPDRKFYK